MKRHGLILLVVLGAAPAAGAQPAPPVRTQPAAPAGTQPMVEVRTAFGAIRFQQNDLDYAAPAVRVAVRVGRRRFAVEPELGFAWGSAPSASHRFRNFGVNAIARGSERVSPYFGGGVGVYSERRESTVNGESGTQTFAPRIGTQIVYGVDVRSTRRIGVFGEGRWETRPFGDAGSSSQFQAFAGVVVTLRGSTRPDRQYPVPRAPR